MTLISSKRVSSPAPQVLRSTATPTKPRASEKAPRAAAIRDGFDSAPARSRTLDLGAAAGTRPSAAASNPSGSFRLNPGVRGLAFEGQTGSTAYSGSVSPTGVEASAETTASTRNGNGVSAGVGFSAGRTEEVSTSDGYTTATTTGEVSFNAEASAKFGRFGVGLGVEFSTTQTQTVRVPEGAWADIESGAEPYPNQYDPESIPVGGSVTTNSEDAHGTELSGSYGGFSANSGLEETEAVSVQVERVDEDTVRVTSGPTSTFEATDGVGIDVGVVGANAGVSRTLEDAQLNTVEFDISTPEGREAYDAYIATGQLPAPDTAGVVDVTQTHRVSYEQSVELGLSVFGFDLSHESEGSSAETVLTTHKDGSSDQVSTVDGNGYVITATSHFPPGSREADSLTYTLKLEDVSAQAIGLLNQVYGEEGGPRNAQDVTLTFTPEDIEELQDVAREKIIQDTMNDGYSEAEAEAALEAYERDPSSRDADILRADPRLLEVATAESPDVVAQNLALLVGSQGGTGFVEELIALAQQTGNVGDGLPFEYSTEG